MHNGYTRQIIYCDMSTHKNFLNASSETIMEAEKRTLRHEITHAFFTQSGLDNDTFLVDFAWSQNEEMIDWLAIQGIKLYNAWLEAGAI